MEYLPSDRICVVIFGNKGGEKVLSLVSDPFAPDWEEKEYTIYNYASDADLNKIERDVSPNVYLTFGDWEQFTNLSNAPYAVRRRWLNFKSSEPLEDVGKHILNLYGRTCFDPPNSNPLVSVITGVYKPGEKIFRPYESLKKQTYNNWEWVVYDDSDDDGETFNLLRSISDLDYRVKPFKGIRRSGRIGQVKKNGFGLASGDFLCELDHDDALTDNCLELLVKTFQRYPEVGMAYTDCCEFFESDGTCVNYGDDFAFGYGSYRKEIYKNKEYLVTNYPRLNQKTVRHIVGVPNHVRCWRATTYKEIGGHNPNLHEVDDYELIVRTFLHSRISHIPKFGYIQYVNTDHSNITDKRRPEIQRLVKMVKEYYDVKIHKRLLELGLPDEIWDNNLQISDMSAPIPLCSQHACIVSEV
jgi:glycosyltransferase involved in cell wall biosynthesis